MAFKLSPQCQSSSMLILPEMHAFSLVSLEQESRLHMWGCFSTGTGTGIDGYGNNSEHIQESFKKIINGVFSGCVTFNSSRCTILTPFILQLHIDLK